MIANQAYIKVIKLLVSFRSFWKAYRFNVVTEFDGWDLDQGNVIVLQDWTPIFVLEPNLSFQF